MKKSMKILIIVLLLIIVGLVTFIITDAIIENSRKESDETIVIENKSGNNSSKQEDVNTTKNTVQNTTAEKNEVSNTNQTAENSKTDTNTTDNKSNAVEAIKTALKDDKWVIENIMMKKSVFDTELEGEQKLTFMILKKDNNGNPMIAIYAEQDLSSEMFLVSYQNGKVTSNSVTGLPIHNGHGGISIDPNNHIAVWGWGHMGTFSNTYYDIKTGKSVTLDKI